MVGHLIVVLAKNQRSIQRASLVEEVEALKEGFCSWAR